MTIHLMMIVFIPVFNTLHQVESVIPIDVVILDIKKEQIFSAAPKERITVPVTTTAPVVKKAEPLNTKPKVEDKIVEPSGSAKPLILPDIDIPKSLVDSDKTVALPDIEDIPSIENPNTFKGPDVDSELKSQDNSKVASKNDGTKPKGSSDTSGADIGTDFFNFDQKPTNNRSIVQTPPIPTFSLSNDATIRVKFIIDKLGNTKNIQYVTRSSAIVEELARDYVSKLKFNSVVYDNPDSAQITIQFKVRVGK